MGSTTVYLDYSIYLTDQALVSTLQQTRFRRAGVFQFYGEPGHPIMAPTDASAEWDAPIQLGDAHAVFVAPPKLMSDWFLSTNNYPRNQVTFTRKSGGWFGISFLFGDSTKFYWRGTFVYAGPAAGESGVPGVTVLPIPERHWIDGFELPDRGEAAPPGSAAGSAGAHMCREASRHIQGFGLHVDRNLVNRSHTLGQYGAAAAKQQWERFYVRIRQFSSSEVRLWRVGGLTAAQEGISLGLLPNGQLAISNIDSIAAASIIFTTSGAPLVVHRWYRIDLIYNFSIIPPPGVPGPGDGQVLLFVDGVQVASLLGAQIAPTAIGLNNAQNIGVSTLGPTTTHTATLEFDDWIGAAPHVIDPISLRVVAPLNVQTSAPDWESGTRLALVSAAGFAADHNVGWSGDWRLVHQRPADDTGPQVLTSTTSAARLSITTDAVREVDHQPNGRGIASMLVALLGLRAGVANGTLGYKLPGAAEVMTAITQTGVMAWNAVLYRPAALAAPITPLDGLELKHDKGAAVDSSSIQFLGAVVEVIGLFGPEDQVTVTAAQAGTPAAVAAGPASGSAALVEATKNGLVARAIALTGPCGAFEITKRVAWALRAQGGGLLSKPTGNNCQGYATDIVAFPGVGVTRIFDVLIDGGGANGPTWSEGTPVDAARYRPAIDPGDTGNTDEGGAPLGDPGNGVAPPLPPHVGTHNAPYPHSPWARASSAPIAPVMVKTGSYVGTGTVRDLAFTTPVHFLWIRPVTGGTGGCNWWASLNSAHRLGVESYLPSLVDVCLDPDFPPAAAEDAAESQTLVRLAGAHADLNAVGVTYSYLAFSDPGMRFCLAGGFQVIGGVAGGTYVNPLPSETFTPEAAFLQHEVLPPSSTMRLGYKGPGHAASTIQPILNGIAELTGALSFGLGTLSAQFALFTPGLAEAQIGYLLFRRSDGSGDPGVPRVVQLASYVGDGSASRTIGLAPASGRRPMWALVVPHNAVAAAMRDPAHTGTTSTQLPNTANATTGITAGGIDQLTVGATLNQNTITYDVLVFPGDAAAGNNGWSGPGTQYPVPPLPTPGGGPWPPEPTDPETPGPEPPDGGGGGGGGGGGEPTDFGEQCVDASTKIINQALSRIGVSKRVNDIVAELSEEAEVARLHYSDDVAATLRDFPWPFATRYAQLVRVAGTATVPANGDWTYAYRVPADLLFARRLVRRQGAGRRWDPGPIDFRLGTDDGGGLLYTDHSEPGLVDPLLLTVELEYTLRLACAASQGDALFRMALIWRHAASLAPVLSKDAKKATFCLQMYEITLRSAGTASANEQEQPPAGPADWIAGRD